MYKNPFGKDSSHWQGGKIKRGCIICGKIFYVDKNIVLKGNGRFCSLSCAGKRDYGHHPFAPQKELYCVVCGKTLKGTFEEPSSYSGYVLIDDTIPVSVGTCYNRRFRRCDKKQGKKKALGGCFGAWKPKFGVVVDKGERFDIQHKTAEERAQELFKGKGKDLPLPIREYVKYLSQKYGGCSEVFLTGAAHYAQAIEGLKSTDDLYKINDEGREWFKNHKG